MRGEPDWTALPGTRRLNSERCCGDASRRIARAGSPTLAMLASKSKICWPDVPGLRRHSLVPQQGSRSTASRRGRWIVALAFLAGVIFASMMARLAFDREAEARSTVEVPETRAETCRRIAVDAVSRATAATLKSTPADGAPAAPASRCLRPSIFPPA